MSIATDIRLFVAGNMNDLGPFSTRDVAVLSNDQWPTSNISVALTDWVKCNWIVGGYRLTKEGKKGGRQTWELVPATRAAKKSVAEVVEDRDVFVADVLDRRDDNTLIVRTGRGDYYRVQRLEW